jgi:prepilin-type N-terminal cleavage/methylation domain-containing protein
MPMPQRVFWETAAKSAFDPDGIVGMNRLSNCPRQKFRGLRSGFTLIELLVVIAIIGILVALLMPAVQASREAARATQCRNNLKQIGIAVHNFHDQYQSLPPSRNYDHYMTWAFLILPYLEQVNLFDDWDPKLKYYYQSDTARLTPIPGYTCPTRRDPTPSIRNDNIVSPFETSGHVPGVTSDYACSAGYGRAGIWNWIRSNGAMIIGKATTNPPTVPVGGFAPPNATLEKWKSRTAFRDLIDGVSNTILVGEKHVRPTRFGIAQEDGAIYNGDHPGSFSRCGGPGYPIARNSTDRFNNNFGSYHAQYCNFLLGDGSVRNISVNISTDLLGRLTSRNDQEVVSNY